MQCPMHDMPTDSLSIKDKHGKLCMGMACSQDAKDMLGRLNYVMNLCFRALMSKCTLKFIFWPNSFIEVDTDSTTHGQVIQVMRNLLKWWPNMNQDTHLEFQT